MARTAKTIMIRVAVEALMPVVVSPVLEPAEEPPAELPPLPLLPEFRPDLAVFLPSSIFDDISDLAGNIYAFSIQNQRSDPEDISERLQAILSPVFTPENGAVLSRIFNDF